MSDATERAAEALATPGPWKVVRNSVFTEVHSGDGDDTPICTLHDRRLSTTPIPKENAKANARLIAAAPDLLEACEIVLFQIKANRPPMERLALIEEYVTKAIDKATGQGADR